MSLEAELYFVAWFKNQQPRVLVGGPFVDRDQAEDFITKHPEADRLGVVTLGPFQFTQVAAASPESTKP